MANRLSVLLQNVPTGTPADTDTIAFTNQVTGAINKIQKQNLVATIVDADAVTKGKIQLAGALGGTAGAPTALGYANAAALAAVLVLLAPLTSPALIGTPTVPTATPGTNTTQAASTAFVKAAIDALVNAAPGALDTLAELATALGNDANFATTVTNALAAKAPLASPALTGTPSAPTAALGTNTTQVATTAFVKAALDALINAAPGALDTLAELATALGNDANFATTMTNALALKAPLASPALTGTPTSPTAAAATNTTQVASTAFVQQEIANKADKLGQTTVGASRDLTAADIGKVLECNTSSGAIVLSVPDSLMSSIGAVFARRNGGNALTFAPKGGSSVVINDPNSVTAGNHGLIGILWDTGNTYTLIA